MSTPRRIIKLGGSLLDTADSWLPRLTAWLARQPAAENLVIVGGGKLADAVRTVDRVKPIDETQAHWLCVRAMAIHAERVARRFPGAGFVANISTLRSAEPSERFVVIDPWRFMRFEEPRFAAMPLPMNWQVTSDSIAARLAELVGATELALLKSALPAGAPTLAAISEAHYVDAWFPHAAASLARVRCVNLLDDAFAEIEIGAA